MAKDCGHKVPCGCKDTGILTPPPCGDGIDCEGTPCSETFDAQCTFYTGEPILCGQDEVITTNMSLSDAITAVVAYFCTTSGHELQQALICGEDTVVAAGSDLDTTLQGIVSYFCGRLSTLETQVGNNTTALLGSVTSGAATCVAAPNGCLTCNITLTFRDNGNNVIDTVALNLPEICPPEAICNSPVLAPGAPPAGARVVLCDNGNPVLIDADEFALAGDIPVVPATNNYGLFSQTANSVPVTDVNNAQSLFGTGEGALTVDPLVYAFQVGDTFLLKGSGHLTEANPTSTLKLEVLFNATVELAIDIPLNTITDLHWNLEMEFVIRSTGVAGTVMTALKFTNQEDAGSDVARTHMSTELANVDTTIANTLDIRATWNSPTAGDSIYSEIMNLYKIY